MAAREQASDFHSRALEVDHLASARFAWTVKGSTRHKTVMKLDATTLNARLLGGHRLLATRDHTGNVIECRVEFFDEPVPVAFFKTYLANGLIELAKDGVSYTISSAGKKRLKGPPGSRR